MDTEKAEEEEFSEWVEIQTPTTGTGIDASTPQISSFLQPSHPREEDGDTFVAPVVEEEGDSSSRPCRVIDPAKKRLKEKDSSGAGLFFYFFQLAIQRVKSNYAAYRRIFLSFSIVGGFFLVSSIVCVKFVRWWGRVHEEKFRVLVRLLGEKDQKREELMLEIGRLKELLSSRRRVRVIRIV